MKKIILATTSPYRIAAFEMLGIPFESCGSDVEEKFLGRPNDPQGLVRELSKQKAEAVAEKYSAGIVIGFDSVGWFRDKILEKPKTEKEERERLADLSGKSFQFFTGVCVIDVANGKKYERVACTDAHMRKLETAEIEKYVAEDPAFRTYALGFDPLGHSSVSFIEKIEGSYNNILRGIPLELIVEMINLIK